MPQAETGRESHAQPATAPAAVPAGHPETHPSLDEALGAARRAIQPVSETERTLEENHGARFFAHNPEQAMVARFFDGPVRMQSSQAGSQWRLEISRHDSAPVASGGGQRVEYRHSDGVIESYENGAAGFQHSFTVPSRAVGNDGDMLRLRMDVAGLTVAGDSSSPGDLCFTDDRGRALAAYRGLKAWDAGGRELAAEMRPLSGGFELAVNDRGATYPVHIDPTFLNLEQTIQPEMAGTAGYDDRFGSAVALDGNTAVVTAQFANSSLSGRGRAYVFVRNGGQWALQAELWADDGDSSDEFGNAVDLDGDTVVVGSWQAEDSGTDDHGAAYVFVRNGQTWSQQAKLTTPTPVYDGQFGSSVSLQGDELLVGSIQAGAFLFRRTADVWQLENQVPASATSYGFGTSVALSGDTMLIGAPREAVGVTSQVGAVYVFTRSGGTWGAPLRIASPLTMMEFNFGRMVALDGDIAVIGAPTADYSTSVTDSGAVAIYRRNAQGGWDQEYFSLATTTARYLGSSVAVSGESVIIGSGATGDGASALYQRAGAAWTLKTSFNYGTAVAIDGPTVLIGARNNPGDGTFMTGYSGAAFVHEFDGASWPMRQRLTMGNSRQGTNLGSALAMQGDTMLVGAAAEPSIRGANVGAAYVFAKSNGVWQPQARLVSNAPGPNRNFGARVALDGETAAVSSTADPYPKADGTEVSNVGSVIVFTRSGTTWSQQQKLYASNHTSSAGFGSGLALRGDNLLVGAPFVSNYKGCVYPFGRSGTTWTQKAVLSSTGSADNQRFGNSIAIDSGGLTAVIGANIMVESVTGLGYGGAGRAFVYTFDGTAWLSRATLQAPSSLQKAWTLFGESVAISGNTILIGSPGVDLPTVPDPLGNKGGVGRCFVFTGSGASWSHQATFDPLNGTQQTACGTSVQIVGDTAVIGSKGSVDVYTRSGTAWTLTNTLQSNLDATNTSFGMTLALDGTLLAVGAPTMGQVVTSIKRTYSGLGAIELFRISTNSTTVTITSPAANPVALADTNRSLRFTASIDTRGAPGTPVIAWSKLSGPGSVSFSNSAALDTLATFPAAGTYVVQCAATHNGATATASRMVVVSTPSVMTFRQGVNGYQQETTMVASDQAINLAYSRNYGVADQFLVGRSTAFGTARGLLSFDLVGLPPGAIVREVSLETTTSGTPGSGAVSPVELRQLPATFIEGAGFWDNNNPTVLNSDSGATWERRSERRPDYEVKLIWGSPGHAGATVLSAISGFNAQTETGVKKTFASSPEFVRAAQEAVRAGRLNLVLRAPVSEVTLGDNCARFHSDDAADPLVRPQLRITYSTGQVPRIASFPITTIVSQTTHLEGLVADANTLLWTKLSGPGSASFSDPTDPDGTVVFDQPGSHVLKVTANNASGEASGTFNIEVEEANVSNFPYWAQSTWPPETPPELVLPGSDPDGDGIVNLLEWALHLDAAKPDTPTAAVEVQGGMMEYRYTRRKTAPGKADFQVEWSDNPAGAWSTAGVGAEIVTPLTETSESVTVTLPAGTNGARFVRLAITR